MKTGSDLIAEAKTRIREISVHDMKAMLAAGANAVYLDVREPQEWNLGHVPTAMHIPRGILEGRVEAAIPRDAKVVIYCAAGNRSALAADTMQQMGYADVVSVAGGWRDWVAADGPVEG
jgi:rhodanese-related sulfurtransferase